jgi:hypothetical protein
LENLVLLLDVRVLLIMFSIITIVFLIIVIVLWNKLSKLRSNYMSMLNGDASINVEQALIDLQEKNTALHNAFAESGNDLSFSIALVDDEQDGLVLSGIHNRDETYVFAKPLEKGQSKYTLSPEEKEAIHRSVQKK